jgi:hypothetical protein
MLKTLGTNVTAHLTLHVKVCTRPDQRLHCGRVTLSGCPYERRVAILFTERHKD